MTGNDIFVTELNGTGTASVFSTFIGGSSDDSTQNTVHSPAIAANATGDAFVVHETSSFDFPVTLTTAKYLRAENRATATATACGTTLAPGLSYTISIEFKPTQTGAANGNLVLNDNAEDSPQFVDLSGTGS